MNRATVVTSWVGDGSRANPYRPKLTVDHPVSSCTDITGQPVPNLAPSPNALVVEVVCDDAQLAAIELCADCLVVTSEVIVEGEDA